MARHSRRWRPGDDDALGPGRYVAKRDGQRLGVAGLEVHAAFGQLRSIVVSPDRRGTGIARALVEERWERARRLGLQRV